MFVRECKIIVRIARAESEEAVSQARGLFREYAASLTADLCFQNFERELARLPGEYAPPEGRLFLAFVSDSPEARAGSEPVDTRQCAPELGAADASIEASTEAAETVGCVALRKFDSTSCEMKRLYVRPKFRGQGIARALVGAVMHAAREIGYRRICLDTLPEMAGAQALYHSIGFEEVSPYRFYPVPGVRFFELPLS